MLQLEQKIKFSDYPELYDVLVPKDNELRRIKDLVDFSFVVDTVRDTYCPDNGRVSEDPVMLFKYLLLKVIYELSDVDVVKRSRWDLSFKYFLDMVPEETRLIDPSSLTRFRRQHLRGDELMNALIAQTIAKAKNLGLIKSSTIIVDATHTRSRCRSCNPVEMLRKVGTKLRKAMYNYDASVKAKLPEKNESNDIAKEMEYTKDLIKAVSANEFMAGLPAVSECLNMLKETLEDIQDHYTTSADPDARIGHKSADTDFFGYKTHIAMCDDGLITAAVVTSGEKPDGAELGRLVEQSRLNGMEVETVVGDQAYSGKENIKLSMDKQEGFELISKLHPSIINGYRKGSEFTFNKDAGMFVCPAGHMATRCYKRKHKYGNDTLSYHFDISKCQICSRRDGCYRPGATCKTYNITIKCDEHKHQQEIQETEEFKEKMKVRYKIEARNGYMKNSLGYDVAESYGLAGMNMQSAMTIYAANVLKILKLLDKAEKEK